MSSTSIAVLGAIAGSTIFLGLPVGRLRNLSPQVRAFLNAAATGVLLFLLIDIVSHANEPLEKALVAATDGDGSWARFVWLAVVAIVGFGIGLLSLVYYERWINRVARPSSGDGPGAALATGRGRSVWMRSNGHRLALLIATGIGLHNFAEGLAIGQSAAAGEMSLALLLVIGFGLHNATEGFGIVAPLSLEAIRPSWGELALLGVIGGGPTFLGTILGQRVVNDTLYLAFLALAAGSILYVTIQLIGVAQKLGLKEALAWGVFVGMLAGFATDYILVAAGA